MNEKDCTYRGYCCPAAHCITLGASLLPMTFTNENELWLACSLLFLGGLMWGPYVPMETTLLQRNVPKKQLGRVFGARSTLLIGCMLLAFVLATVVITLSAFACILVGLSGLALPTYRGLSLPTADADPSLEIVDLPWIFMQAEAFLRKYTGDIFDAHSAGVQPNDVNPLTLRVMNEV